MYLGIHLRINCNDLFCKTVIEKKCPFLKKQNKKNPNKSMLFDNY